jgi:glycosyltransferase involved in cell wall biosynthesis
MAPELSVSVVIPTVGRPSLHAAAESALRQTVAPLEVIVVLDADREPHLPDSPAVKVVRTSGGLGPGGARHAGIAASRGDVIALLDDDDTWSAEKLERQLAAAPQRAEWIVSCRFVTRPPAGTPVVFPRRLYESGSVGTYLFEFHTLRKGRSALQTSTLVFPRTLADRVPLSVSAGMIHDEPTWLIEVQRAFPDVEIVHLPDLLVEYGFAAGSMSRSSLDQTSAYIDWGRRILAGEPKRTQGDYHLTNPVSSALAAGSPRGVVDSMRAAIQTGRPGPWAWAYAVGALGRIGARRVRGTG